MTSILSGDLAFTQLVKLVSTTISSGKRNELFPFLSLIDEARKTMDASLLDFKVAVTFSPKLADRRCTLYPVEGVWDLFFCFLEQENGVSLSLSG